MFRSPHPLAGFRQGISFTNRLLCGVCRAGTASGTSDAVEVVAGRAPRKEVGKMAYMVIGIGFIVLEVVAAVRMRTGHA